MDCKMPTTVMENIRYMSNSVRATSPMMMTTDLPLFKAVFPGRLSFCGGLPRP